LEAIVRGDAAPILAFAKKLYQPATGTVDKLVFSEQRCVFVHTKPSHEDNTN